LFLPQKSKEAFPMNKTYLAPTGTRYGVSSATANQ